MAKRLDECYLPIGPVHILIDVQNLLLLVDCITDIKKAINQTSLGRTIQCERSLVDSEWNLMFYDKVRAVYSLIYKGVAWDVSPFDLYKCIDEDALPFLARGTVTQLLRATPQN